MKGKADRLVANRTLSALAVVCLVISAFAGLLFMADVAPTRAAEGDLIVQNETYIIERDQPIDGNVEVLDGGELIIRDATLSIISNNASGLRHEITVFAGGKLILDHGAITPYLDQIDPWPFLDINVQGNGSLVATNNSLLMFPGNITLTAGAFVSLTDTEIMALPTAQVTLYMKGSGISEDSADDGPAITLTDSTLELYDSSIYDLPEYGANVSNPASDLVLNGESTLLAINSFISVDFGPARDAGEWRAHNRIVLSDQSVAHLYGCSFQTYAGDLANRVAAIVANGVVDIATPSAKESSPRDTTVGQNVVSLSNSSEGLTYHVFAGQLMGIDSFDAGPPVLTVDSAVLLVRYIVDPGYDGTRSVNWSTDEGVSWNSTGIVPLDNETSFVERSYDLHANGVTDTSQLAALDVCFLHDGSAGQVQFDSMSIVISVGPSAYVYRWVNVIVGDEYGVPVPNATVSAIFTGSESYGGQPSFYFGDDGAQPLPPSEVLSYMGKDGLTFGVTERDGIVAVPYLTDIITAAQAPDSLFVGSFDITGTKGTHNSTESFSFPAYPAMTHADQSFEVTVSIVGFSAPSPDPSRWLVVPPSLEIRDMTYYHAGDVIVAGGGTLSITNSTLRLVQPGSYTKTIYVDGNTTSPARLLFVNSNVTSEHPINIIVKGDGILEAYDTEMKNVNIVIEENAHILFSNVKMDGKITTAWDSWARNISIRDSNLGEINIPKLSGSVVAGFTNTSVKAIEVTGDAVALIYRWIHVTVLDGAGMPLPGVNVSTRYYVNQSLAGWAMSSAALDSLGVAKVNSLGTKLTSIGSTFVGNYWVNATYTYPPVTGLKYYASQEISLGVEPYEPPPLQRNATFATMYIPDALSDLTVSQTPTPVWTNIPNPKMGDNVTVYGRINNTGVASAYDITVEFFDDLSGDSQPQDDELFATATVPVIMAGSSAVVSAYWTAVGPIFPGTHRLLVVADRANRIPEITETPAIGLGNVTVQSLPDIKVTAGTLGVPDIWASTDLLLKPAVPIFPIVGIPCYLLANIYNDGDNTSKNVTVDFYDGTNFIRNTTVTGILPHGNFLVASVPWMPTGPGVQHSIRVVATLESGYDETRYDNNEATVLIKVYDPPDLVLSEIKTTPDSFVPGGETVTVRAKLQNLHEAPFAEPNLTLSVTWAGGSKTDSWREYGVTLSSTSGSIEVTRSFTAPIVTAETPLLIVMRVNSANDPVESNNGVDNMQQMSIMATDVRPDLSIASSDIYVQRDTTNVTSDTFGRQVNVRALVWDRGGRSVDAFEAAVGVRNAAGYNITLFSKANYNISANETERTLLITVPWTINLTTPGAYQIWVLLDGTRAIAEPNEANNFATAPFNITQLSVDVTVTTDFAEYNAGDMMVITATINYANMNDPVKGLPGVVFWLLDSSGALVPGSNSTFETTDQDGGIIVLLRIPPTLDTGTYTVRTVVLGTGHDSATSIHVSAQVSGGLFPWWVWVLIIVAVVGVVAGFTVYTYIYGLGKLVECGECGAFIPAASKRCPKCGVEFEAGTMKCSECGAWIPAESTECPNCGVKFAGETEVEADYLERMRKEYDEIVSKYRELAKPELGKKFSEKAFEAWWMAQPGYISFDDWLAKEEEKKKEGPVPCPVCGTLNPKEASVCHKCGTVFGVVKPAGAPPKKGPPPVAPVEQAAVEEAPLTEDRGGTQAQQMPPAMAPRMVIRRPIDRKVVPKKIIKTPVSGEERKEGEDEEENQ